MTSRLNWRLSVDGNFLGGSCYAVSGRLSLTIQRHDSREVRCLDYSGQTAWRRSFPFKDTANFFPYEDRLYVDGHAALALDVRTGADLARREFGDTMVRHPNERGPVYIIDPGADVPTMVGLDPSSLETTWEWSDGLHYACIGDWLIRRQPSVGTHLVNAWTREETTLRPEILPPDSARDDLLVPRGSDVIIVATRLHRQAYAVPAARTIWTHAEDSPGRHRLLWFDKDRMLCGTDDVRAYSLHTGELLWDTSLPGGLPDRSASAAGRAAFALAGKRRVCRLVLESGELTGTFDLKEDVLDLAALDDTHVVAGTLDHLYCIEFS